MPRNDQLIRQWHLLQRLEGSRGASLSELAGALPADLIRHHRTIRRDLEALEAAGFPLVSETAAGATRWRLLDGFRRLPALGFAPTELMALVFSQDLLRPLDGTQLKTALDSALGKVATALPPAGHDFVRQMRDLFAVRVGPHKSYRRHRETVDRLARAIAARQTVQMRYFSAARGATSRREVDPYRLWYVAGGLYLVAYDHRRREVRTFAIERIRSLTVTDHPYQLPLGFDIEDYGRDALVVMRGRQVEVELAFDRRTAVWVRDRVWHPSQVLTPLKHGRLRLALRVADTRELMGWVLSFGSGVRVLRPASLQEAVRDEARRIARGAVS